MIRNEQSPETQSSDTSYSIITQTFNLKNQRSTNMLNVEGLMASAFQNAIENPENINEDGSLNWNFVEADVWMDMSDSLGRKVLTEDIYPTFDDLATDYLKINT